MGVAVLIGAGVFAYFSASATEKVVDLRGQKDVSVVLTDQGFEPRDIRISAGTTVTFTTTRHNQFWPASDPHPVHTIYPAFDPRRPLDPSESWSFTFDTAGQWGFHDHVRSYFTGTMYVE